MGPNGRLDGRMDGCTLEIEEEAAIGPRGKMERSN
jgi:hypothetical protein